jgi:hypothetical protein
MTLLGDCGVTIKDYTAVQKARELVDEVNARLAQRGATVRFWITVNPVTPLRPWDDATVLEGRAGPGRTPA